MLTEIWRSTKREVGNALSPEPSKKLKDFNNSILGGNDPRIGLYGKSPRDVIIEVYGRIKGEERERLRIPWGDREKSYFAKIGPDGNINVYFEGFYPRGR